MTTIISRRDGRYEIRESVSTPRGPRSITLAIFSQLSSDVLEQVIRRATRPLDLAAIKGRAEELGVPWIGPASVPETRRVLARLASNALPATFLAALKEATSSSDARVPATVEPMLYWIDKDDAVRGRAVFDLIELGDTIMRSRGGSREGPLRFPVLKDL